MPVTTIMTKKEGLPSFVIYLLGIVGVGLVVFFGGQVIENLGNLGGKAGVSNLRRSSPMLNVANL